MEIRLPKNAVLLHPQYFFQKLRELLSSCKNNGLLLFQYTGGNDRGCCSEVPVEGAANCSSSIKLDDMTSNKPGKLFPRQQLLFLF